MDCYCVDLPFVNIREWGFVRLSDHGSRSVQSHIISELVRRRRTCQVNLLLMSEKQIPSTKASSTLIACKWLL